MVKMQPMELPVICRSFLGFLVQAEYSAVGLKLGANDIVRRIRYLNVRVG